MGPKATTRMEENPFVKKVKVMKSLQSIQESIVDKSVWVENGAQIIGLVKIGRGVKILRNAIVKGPTIIGDRTIIGNGSLIRQSIIGTDCVIGYNTEIVRSYIGCGCTFHTNFIGDSIVGNNSFFGYASCTSTVRLDDKKIIIKTNKNNFVSNLRKVGVSIGNNCRIGSFVNFMPGICVGTNCHISPCLLISKPIANNSFVGPSNSGFITKINNKQNSKIHRNIFNKTLLKNINKHREK